MESKLYVGNLSYDTTEDDLRELFAKAGTVVSVALIKDRDTNRSKGFAFVEMSSQAEAEAAIKQFHGMALGGRNLTVNVARPKEDSGGFRGGRSGGGGGYGGGGGGGYGGGGGGGGYGDRDRNRRGPGGGNKGGGTRRY